MYYLIPYCAMSLGAFAVIAARERELGTPVTLDNLAGFGWERPFFGVSMWVFMLGFLGFPLTGGFWGKIYVFQAIYEHGWWWLIVIGVVATMVSAAYYLAVVRAMFLRDSVELHLAPAGGSPPRELVLGIGVAVGARGHGRLVLRRAAAGRRRPGGGERAPSSRLGLRGREAAEAAPVRRDRERSPSARTAQRHRSATRPQQAARRARRSSAPRTRARAGRRSAPSRAPGARRAAHASRCSRRRPRAPRPRRTGARRGARSGRARRPRRAARAPRRATKRAGRVRRPTGDSFALRPDDPSLSWGRPQRKEWRGMATLTWLGHATFLLVERRGQADLRRSVPDRQSEDARTRTGSPSTSTSSRSPTATATTSATRSSSRRRSRRRRSSRRSS